MIGRVRGRRAFVKLQREGKRVRAGSLAVVFRPDGNEIPALAFSIGRGVGSAVRRNLARRRLREAFAALVRHDPDLVAPGDYLVVVRSCEFDYDQGEAWLKYALQRLAR